MHNRNQFCLIFWGVVIALPISLKSWCQNKLERSNEPLFTKITITRDFISEGMAIADINKDGKPDILAGAYWFEAPDWKPHEIFRPQQYDPATGYSNSFLDFSLDVDQDGWPDLIRIGLPGEEAVWYHNPGKSSGYWPMYSLLQHCGNESPAFVDVDGDGRADLLCNDPVAKEMIWMQAPVLPGDTTWTRHLIARGEMKAVNRYTHGLGFADMNGDGRKDVIVNSGWWESPADPKQENWFFHPANLSDDCSQIYLADVKADGTRCLLSSSAHNYGIWWHEPVKDEKGDESWVHHVISKEFSQTHALALADINGDGYADLITGKRYFAHNGKDPGAFEPAVLYWFEFHPGKEPVWIPHKIDPDSGVGLQVLVYDINQDGLPDILESNKKGLHIFIQQRAK